MLGVISFISCLSIALGSIKNTSVTRRIDISTNIAKVTTTYLASGVETEYKFALPLEKNDRLSFLQASSKGASLKCKRIGEKHGFALYSVPAPKGGTDEFKLETTAVYTDVLLPYPKEITQLELQYVVYKDTVHVPSPYPTATQKTEVKLASSHVNNIVGEEPMDHKGTSIIAGPYTDEPGLGEDEGKSAAKELKIHYMNNAPFAKATSCLREIEVSHWGNIAVEELYDLEHNGAKLKGEFSRLDHMRRTTAQIPSPVFTALMADLPAGAHDLYFRDNIGNVSTSSVQTSLAGVKFTVSPRYPMMGGWKTAWYQGYNLPLENGLRRDSKTGVYTLSMNFGVPFSTMWVDDLTVKVVLPEGARSIVASVPFEVEEQRTVRFTYFDTSIMGGRPVLVFKKKNVVTNHNIKFKVTYKLSTYRLFLKPLMLVAVFACMFAACIAYSRREETSKLQLNEARPKAD